MKWNCSVVVACCCGLLYAGGQDSPPTAAKKQATAAQPPAEQQTPTNTDAVDDDTPDEELAPAAVRLDPSRMPPLTRVLYEATRETKEKEILDRLDEAMKLIRAGADLTALDARRRTALHWAVFGASYNTKPKVVVAYEEIADELLSRGIDVNAQDIYQDTALDYLLYSPNFEIQTLMLERGANSGFLAGAKLPADRGVADLTPGQTVDVRLLTPVYSDRSRTGDPIEAVVTYPLCKNGEFTVCKDGELLLSPGMRVSGTVLFAQKAPDKYSQPRLVLDFANLMHKSGQTSPFYSRVLSVDNARESVRNNEILGIVQPHASKKVSITMMAISVANPIAGYTVKAVQTAYGLSIRRETAFPAGTDVQVQVVRPSSLRQRDPWDGWKELSPDSQLQNMIEKLPSRTYTAKQVPSDITNLIFLGTQQQLLAAFGEAGWFQADELTLRSATKTLQATIRQSGYASAPVSGLRIDDRLPDLVFQKSLNTFAKRHHLRVWKQSGTYNGREVWLAAATHDIAISNAKAGTKWSHRIDPHIDRERDWVATDLLFAGTAAAYVEVDRSNVPKKAANATGDQLLTDGKIGVVDLGKSSMRERLLGGF